MERGLMVAMLAVAIAATVAADPRCTTTCTFAVAGRKYNLQNEPVPPGGGVVCPEGNPSSVTFCNGGQTVKIVGNFAAAGLGVCDPSVNPYTLSPSSVVTYEQYGDQVIMRISDRVPAAFRCMVQDGKVCLGLSGGSESYLADAGPANC